MMGTVLRDIVFSLIGAASLVGGFVLRDLAFVGSAIEIPEPGAISSLPFAETGAAVGRSSYR